MNSASVFVHPSFTYVRTIFGVLFLLGCLLVPSSSHAQEKTDGSTYERARVLRTESTTRTTSGTTEQVHLSTLRFLSGPLKGQEREIAEGIGSNPYQIRLNEGNTVVVLMQPTEDGRDWELFIEGFDRRWPIIILILLFVLTLVLLAGWQGFKVALSIGISLALIGYVLIPAFLQGINPVPVAIVLGGVFTLLSCGLSSGWNKKAVVTAVGTMGGALIAYALSVVFVHFTHLSGLSTEEDRLFFQKNPTLNPRGLLFAGIIIASAGALEDVAVSIVSGISEVHKHNPRLGFRALTLSGIAIGRDHMSALANTLVYAYVGASLSTLLLYKQFDASWLKFINFDTVVNEIIRSLCGTIGLVFTVPITALLTGWVVSRESWKDDTRISSTHTHTHQKNV